MNHLRTFAISALLALLAIPVAIAADGARADGPPDWDGDGVIAGDCRPLDPAVRPGATDVPDLAFEDSDCDGVDGRRAAAWFVQPSGNDNNAGSANAPFRTIGRAVQAARSSATKAIYIATGTYDERVVLPPDADAIGLYGGYEAGTWGRTTATKTIVNGQPEALYADGARDVVIQLVTLTGARGGSASAYGVRAVNHSEVALIRSAVSAGAGAAGGAGTSPGKPARAAGGADGNAPPNCDTIGTGGTNANQSGNGTNGGSGGSGGNHTNDGENGNGGGKGDGASGGEGGAGGIDLAGDPDLNVERTDTEDWDGDGDRDGWDLLLGKPGHTGGAGGRGGDAGGGGDALDRAGAAWSGYSGGDGTSGGAGYGGGGGGGGAGRGVGGIGAAWQAGAGGGQGGDGGAGADGGTGGGFGGGSFGMYLHDSDGIVVAQSALRSSDGGRGGDGGTGGSGGDGGPGGQGAGVRGDCRKTSGNGGNGGSGGAGGDGGHGGGGSGGPSAALIRIGASSATVSESTSSAGAGGEGGTGPGNAGEGATGRHAVSLPAGSTGTTDFDGDGITDSTDRCVDVARGTDTNADGCPDRAAALPDGDGDGVPNDGRDACPAQAAGVDADHNGCADPVVTATPTAVPTTKPSEEPQVIHATVDYNYKSRSRGTQISALVVRAVPSGATVSVSCRGRGCPPRPFTTRKSGRVRVTVLDRRWLRKGSVVTISVTKAGMVGNAFELTTRDGRPRVRSLCLPPGASKPARCGG